MVASNFVSVNGNREYIDSLEDIYDLIDKYMGYEMRDITEETFTDFLEIEEIRTRNASEEKDSYEADLESNQRAFHDIQDEIDHLGSMERFSRKAILEAIKNIKVIISNQI